jgi:hypothetical protein
MIRRGLAAFLAAVLLGALTPTPSVQAVGVIGGLLAATLSVQLTEDTSNNYNAVGFNQIIDEADYYLATNEIGVLLGETLSLTKERAVEELGVTLSDDAIVDYLTQSENTLREQVEKLTQ